MVTMEARFVARGSARVLSAFHDLESALGSHPESRWRALALMSMMDRQYLSPARDAIQVLAASWGDARFRQYHLRQDDYELSRPLLHSKSAKQ